MHDAQSFRTLALLLLMLPSHRFWAISRGEVRVAVAALAIAFWAITIAIWVRAPLPCGDFVCPYTMGWLVHEPERIYDVDAFHAAQVALVPASASLFYPPVYPPQLAVAMAPFSRLSFGIAVTIWSGAMIVLYALIVRNAYRALNLHLDPVVFPLLAIAFPPFVEMVQYGQNTVLLLGACFLAWRALEAERPFLGGAALGLLALKPQFGLPFAVLVLAGGEWQMLAGATCSVAVQAAIVWIVMGSRAFTGFLGFVPEILANANALENVPERVHSIRSVTRLLPHVVETPAWIAAVGVMLVAVAIVWRSSTPVRVRLGFAILAGVLISPHLILYDATLLALPLLWLADWARISGYRKQYAVAIGVLFVAFALPWSALTRIQPSVLVMLWIAHQVWRSVRLGQRPPEAAIVQAGQA